MPFAIVQISVANLDLNSTNTMEGRCHTTKIFRFRGTTFKTLTNPGSYPANPSLTNPGTTKNRLRKFRGAKVQTQKNIEQNYNSFFLTFSTLHLCTLQIFTIYFDLVVLGLLIEKIHTICPPPCPLKTMRVSRYTLAQLCDWKANIVWWGCGGGSTSRSSTSSDQ